MKGQTVNFIPEKDIGRIINYFEKKEKHLILLGVVKFALNTGLRISDILNLKFEDLQNKKLNEIKTKKNKYIFFNDECLKVARQLKKFYKSKNIENYNSSYIFKSLRKKDYPISYQGINFYLKKCQKYLKIDYPFNTHSFRKTWARMVYKTYGNDIVLVMKLLNHSSPEVTLRYIQIEAEELINVYKKIKL